MNEMLDFKLTNADGDEEKSIQDEEEKNEGEETKNDTQQE